MFKPTRLYKYRAMDKHASDLFCRKVMYFNVPSKLNDPFELGPVLDGSCNQLSWRKAIFSETHDVHADWTPAEIAAEVDRRAGEYPPSTADLEATFDAYRTRLDEVGMLSASARWDSIVMWSHYAASHTGFCVELDPGALPSRFEFHPVVYLKHRPNINVFSDRDSANKTAAFSKNEEWRYEDEWRLVLTPTAELKFPQEIDVPEGFVSGVILGAMMTEEDRTRVLDWVSELSPAVETHQAFIDASDYRVGRRQCDI